MTLLGSVLGVKMKLLCYIPNQLQEVDVGIFFIFSAPRGAPRVAGIPIYRRKIKKFDILKRMRYIPNQVEDVDLLAKYFLIKISKKNARGSRLYHQILLCNFDKKDEVKSRHVQLDWV